MDAAILARVEDFCIREGLLQPGAPQHLAAAVSGGADSMALLLSLAAGKPLHLAAAVSGGADSMALLHLLLALQAESGFVLSVCHVNHGLRGETADRDEAFVREACTELGLPLRVFRPAEVGFTVPPHAGEDWARRLRYACFEQLRQEGIDCIATAHTASDQAETLLFRLARGTGLHGAGGIRPKRPGYCRPLLGLTRAETEAVCTARGQRWVTDETNESDAYARNRLRGAVRAGGRGGRLGAGAIAKGRPAHPGNRPPQPDGPGAGRRGKIHPPAGSAGAARQRGGAADRRDPVPRRGGDILAGKNAGCLPEEHRIL